MIPGLVSVHCPKLEYYFFCPVSAESGVFCCRNAKSCGLNLVRIRLINVIDFFREYSLKPTAKSPSVWITQLQDKQISGLVLILCEWYDCAGLEDIHGRVLYV